jgi:hypothetical protein
MGFQKFILYSHKAREKNSTQKYTHIYIEIESNDMCTQVIYQDFTHNDMAYLLNIVDSTFK